MDGFFSVRMKNHISLLLLWLSENWDVLDTQFRQNLLTYNFECLFLLDLLFRLLHIPRSSFLNYIYSSLFCVYSFYLCQGMFFIYWALLEASRMPQIFDGTRCGTHLNMYISLYLEMLLWTFLWHYVIHKAILHRLTSSSNDLVK